MIWLLIAPIAGSLLFVILRVALHRVLFSAKPNEQPPEQNAADKKAVEQVSEASDKELADLFYDQLRKH